MRPKCGMTVKIVFEPSTGNCDCRKTSCLKTAKQCDKIYKQVKIAALREAMIAEGGIDAVIAWFRELRDSGHIVIKEGRGTFAPMFEISKGEKA